MQLFLASLGLYTTQEFLLEKKVSLWRKSSYQPVLDLYDLTLGLNILDQFDFNINYRGRCLILMDAAHRVEFKYLPLSSRMARNLNMHVNSLVFISKKLTRRIPRGPKGAWYCPSSHVTHSFTLDVTYIGGDQVATASPLYIGVRCVLNGVERKIVAFVDTGKQPA